jgi:hypothetical protein
MEGTLVTRETDTVMPRDKREAVPTIRALIDEAEAYLHEYGRRRG